MEKMGFVEFMEYVKDKVNNASSEELSSMYENSCFNISFQDKTCSVKFDAQAFNCITQALENMKDECEDC